MIFFFLATDFEKHLKTVSQCTLLDNIFPLMQRTDFSKKCFLDSCSPQGKGTSLECLFSLLPSSSSVFVKTFNTTDVISHYFIKLAGPNETVYVMLPSILKS